MIRGVISGALPGIKATFSLSLLMIQVVTSWVTLGALAGSLAAGALLEYFIRPGGTHAVPNAFLIGAKTHIDF